MRSSPGPFLFVPLSPVILCHAFTSWPCWVTCSKNIIYFTIAQIAFAPHFSLPKPNSCFKVQTKRYFLWNGLSELIFLPPILSYVLLVSLWVNLSPPGKKAKMGLNLEHLKQNAEGAGGGWGAIRLWWSRPEWGRGKGRKLDAMQF